MNRELLQQALEALKSAANNECNFFFYKIAANAIQEELAKPEQEPIGVVQRISIAGYPMADSTGVEWLTTVSSGTKLYASQPVSADNSIKTVMSTKHENVDTFEEHVHKSDKSVHEPVAYWNTQDGFIRADDAQYVSSWSDYYPEPLYAAPQRKGWVGITGNEIAEISLKHGTLTKDDFDFARAIEAKLKDKNYD